MSPLPFALLALDLDGTLLDAAGEAPPDLPPNCGRGRPGALTSPC
ncbi:hypothetical protein [Deinococcus multiflagellatus]|uniref:Uncharacterized protein n=1 Tax=Deinococcus multiflagellatus TaxID=1656887 RepID=A0ABW1ZDR0_9DEIO